MKYTIKDLLNLTFVNEFFKDYPISEYCDEYGDCNEVSSDLIKWIKTSNKCVSNINAKLLYVTQEYYKVHPGGPYFHYVVLINNDIIDLTYGQFNDEIPYKSEKLNIFLKEFPIVFTESDAENYRWETWNKNEWPALNNGKVYRNNKLYNQKFYDGLVVEKNFNYYLKLVREKKSN